MHSVKVIMGLTLFSLSTGIFAAPIANTAILVKRQGAGVGAGCNSVLSDSDTSSGLLAENAENGLAGEATAAKTGGKLRRLLARQGAGVGAGCNSILSDSDTSSGLLVENAENGLAGEVTAASGAGKTKRQLNKIADGTGTLLDAAGATGAGGTTSSVGDAVDGDGTNDSAQIGADVGQLELDTLPAAGSAVPKTKSKRQLNKIADGTGTLLDAAGATGAGGTTSSVGDAVDGDGTNDSAQIGADVGQLELDTLPAAGSAVPK